MAIVNSKERKNDGGEYGILGGRPPVYDWDAFAKEMNEKDPDKYYLSPHMKKWLLENWGKTEQEIQSSFRKQLWNKFGKNPTTSVSSPEKQKAYRESVRGRLSKRFTKFRNKKGLVSTQGLADLINRLEEVQKLDLEKNTILDYYSGELLNLEEDNWQLDHIDPQGGNNADNCALTLEQYNQMKNAWSIEETLDACERLLKNLRPHVLKNSS